MSLWVKGRPKKFFTRAHFGGP